MSHCNNDERLLFVSEWAIFGQLSFMFVFSINKVNSKPILPMTGFEPGSSHVGSDRSVINITTMTIHKQLNILHLEGPRWLYWSRVVHWTLDWDRRGFPHRQDQPDFRFSAEAEINSLWNYPSFFNPHPNGCCWGHQCSRTLTQPRKFWSPTCSLMTTTGSNKAKARHKPTREKSGANIS